ncbi:MAG: hypothetical protein KJZ85_18395 [Rhodobacteraceae bacterium]|jgi:hypothetical protein|nr:hypothetical protein [Paracoccaceae bacterium]
MTALRRYQRLECTGLWREGPGTQRIDVGIAFGEATLVVAELRSGRAVAHWSLPAVVRLNPGSLPALYAPGPDAPETLEIDDLDMIAAITAVRAALDLPAARRTGVRLALWAASLAAVSAAGLFWLPGALVAHTAAVVPEAKRAEIGRALQADAEAAGGPACRGRLALPALARLRGRLPGAETAEIVVLPQGPALAAHLPGRIVVVSRTLIEAEEGPEAAAAAILAELLRAEAADPLEAVLHAAGLVATFTLLTTGDLPAGALAGVGAARLAAPPGPVDLDALGRRLVAAGIPAGPYARRAGLADGTLAGAAGAAALLHDDAWVALQGICDP